MKLKEVASYVWNNSIEIGFGNRPVWDQDTFKSSWFLNNHSDVWKRGGASGLYWFTVKNKTYVDLKQIQTPDLLPKKATNIAEIVSRNIDIFQENLCTPNKEGTLVIYNGHEQNVFARIRSHFVLGNDSTTAVGFRNYEISQFEFNVRIFHNKLSMDDLSKNNKFFIQRLLSEKAGREAIESNWRAFNGWPVLCKR